MKEKKIVANVIENLKSYSDLQRIIQAQTNFPTSMTVLGVKNPDRIKVLKELKEDLSVFDFRERIEIAKKLVKTDIIECQHMAYTLIGKDKKLKEHLTLSDILELAGIMDNWVSVDTYGIYISGYGYREGILPEKQLIKWLKSSDFWYRRLAVVSTVPLNLKSQGGTGDTERTLRICTYAVNDKHDMVAKALSWALRELSKREPELVHDYIKEYENKLPRRVIREVNHKLKTGRKN